jgi:two-component system alkaline phosphatase synthesis response regulator PhoP
MPQRKRILCVDDNEDICQMLVLNFSSSDIEAISTTSVTEALKLAEREEFDLYVLDLTLRSALDEALCEAIRDRDKATPIVVFTGKSDEQDRLAALSAGANAYVLKPHFEELTRTVHQLLYGQG